MNTQRARVAAVVLVVVAGLGLALVASRSGRPLSTSPAPGGSAVETLPAPVATTTPLGNQSPSNAPPAINYVAYLYVVIAAALMFLGLMAVPFLFGNRPRGTWRRFFRRRYRYRVQEPPRPKASAPVLLADAVETALATLEQGEVDDVIVACWIGLERAAAAAGTRRTVAETSAELTERLLAEHQVSPDTLRDLAALYREARFSEHPLTEEHRDRARALFGTVRDELRVAA